MARSAKLRQSTGHATPLAPGTMRGDATGLAIPAHAAALIAAGPEFLTRAFHAYGSLARDNRVVAIVAAERFVGGNSGDKLRLTLDYACADPELHRDIFVKFSRDFGDAFRDRRRAELDAEIRLASLSRHPAFPVPVARPYFGDMHAESGTGVLMTQAIAFGQGAIEPLRRKGRDRELDDPLSYYRAIVTALARLAAAHHAGRLSPEVERLFPFDRERAISELAIPWSEAELGERLDWFADFIRRCPGLLPANVAESSGFMARFRRDALTFLRHQSIVREHLYADPDCIALSHWNTHLDNAWFWRDTDGVRRCGLLDWGMARPMNMAIALWGGLSGADAELWAHRDDLLAIFVEELSCSGGPALNVAALGLDLDLAIATIGLAQLMDMPSIVLGRVPGVERARDLHDPLFDGEEVARGFLHVAGIFLSLWEQRDFGSALAYLIGPETE